MKNTICVIDDDVIYQKIIRKLIARANIFQKTYFYVSARDAQNDLMNAELDLPSVILLDINMPIMDGWQFLDYLENTYPYLYDETKIFIVTSSIAYSDKEKIKEYPKVSGFLSKPMTVDKLKNIGNVEV